MKKACSLVVSALLIAALALLASAASTESDGAAAILPIDVVVDQEAAEIRKVYSLPPSVDPEALPREGFDRDGYHYECSDILREVVMGDETQSLTQTETVESKNREMETLLALLPQESRVGTRRLAALLRCKSGSRGRFPSTPHANRTYTSRRIRLSLCLSV